MHAIILYSLFSSDSFPNVSLKSSQPRIVLTAADSGTRSSRTAGCGSRHCSHLSSNEDITRTQCSSFNVIQNRSYITYLAWLLAFKFK